MSHLFQYDALIFEEGVSSFAGVDEAGRGPLAGPVVAAACMIQKGIVFEGVDDSKKLSASKREELFSRLTSSDAVSYGIGIVSEDIIDQVNILQATMIAMRQAIQSLPLVPDLILVDGVKLTGIYTPCLKLVRGDAISQMIAAASILAKVTRDRLMQEAHTKWPQYGFSSHKGYGTKRHLEAIDAHGPCPIHRKTFAPISHMLSFDKQLLQT